MTSQDRLPPPTGRTIAIGDIHGCAFALDAVLDAIQPSTNDQIICLGDIIDFGRETRDVIDRLMQLKQECRLVAILGNHEEMLLNAVANQQLVDTWLNLGGFETIKSYQCAGTLADIPVEHIEFVRGFLDYFETKTHFFTHANYDPELPLAETPGPTLRWLMLEQPYPTVHESGKIAIVGHTEQSNGEILDLNHIKCIDTGCHGYGWLTALDVGSGQHWQASRWGALRKGESIDTLRRAKMVLRP